MKSIEPKRKMLPGSPVIPPVNQDRTYPGVIVVILFILLLLSVIPEHLTAQQAIPSINRDTLRTGDIFTYYIRVTGLEAFDHVTYPDSAAFGPDFVIRDKSVQAASEGDSLIYTLQLLGVDIETIPEMNARLVANDDTLFLPIPELSFVYQSRVDDIESELRPLKPIFPFFRNWWPVILLAIVIVSVMGFLIYRFRNRIFVRSEPGAGSEIKIEPFYDPLELLYSDLDNIKEAFAKPHKLAKPYYTELGDAFRRYFERTHKFPAMESTTEEVIGILQQKQEIDREVIRMLSFILRQADLVKFAKFQPDKSDCLDVMGNCKRLADRIALTDKLNIEALRNEHEVRQRRTQVQLSERIYHDLG